MKPPAALLAVALLLLLAPAPGHAQAAPAPLLADATGDVRVFVQGSDSGDGSSLYPALDLEALTIQETASEFILTLTLADLKPGNEDSGVDGARYEVSFQHNGRFFRLTAFRQVPVFEDTVFYDVQARDSATGEWGYIWGHRAMQDLAADTLTMNLPRRLLADAKGAFPYPGRLLEDIRVNATATASEFSIDLDAQAVQFPVIVRDDMPAPTSPAAVYMVSVGLAQTGSARLFSEEPFRASNGEATTFVYKVLAINAGTETETFTLQATSVPGRIAVVLPVPALALEPEEVRDIPVLVTIPFGHEHGTQDEFVLEMHGSTPDSVGRLLMGVTYLAVPQPAGHHDTVYLHTRPGEFSIGPLTSLGGFMNTLDDDPNDLGGKYYANRGISLGPGSFSIWRFPLGPTLAMGLDFDLNRTAKVRFTLGSTVPLLQCEMFGGLGIYGTENGYQVFDFPDQAAFDLLPNQPKVFDFDLPVNPDADLIPYAAGNNMYFDVFMFSISPSGTTAADEGPFMEPGGFLQLPLFEYHDQVDDVLSSLGGPGLSPLGAQERLVNPGEAVVFPVSIANPADDAVTYGLEFSGPNQEWASLPSARIEVPAHATATASLIVRAPPGAPDGERADLVLQAYSTKDPSVRGLLRLVAEVDTDGDHPDDTEEAAKLEKKDTPPAGAGLVLAALALGAFVRRRR